MKKILFLLLVTISSYGQTLQNPTFGTVKSMTAPTVSTTPTLGTIEANGTISKIVPNNVPITYTPINYAPSSTSIVDQIAGIDARLGQIGNVTAGVTTRVHLTGDNITVTAGTFFASNTTGKGATAAGTPQQTLSNNDNQKQYFTKDVLSVAVPALTTAPPGVYSGQLTVSSDPTPGTSKQRFTIEIYKTNNGGTPIASGITGAPVGALGVTVVAILDSGLINVVAGSLTNIGMQGNLASTLTLNTGERLRYHVSAEKVGTDGGAVTMNVYYGSNYNSYYDIPVTFRASTVLNDSGVSGQYVDDALNTLNTGLKSKLDKVWTSNYDVADSNTTISGTTFDSFGILVQSLTNKIFMFYREGAGHVSPDGKIAMRTSTDGGKTFSSRSIIYSDVAGIDCRNIAGGVTPSGRILLFFLKYNYVVPTFYSFGTIYSDDDGLTWSAYSAQTVPSGASGYSPYGNMIAIADGKLALPYYIEKSDGTESTYLKFSSDNGATWGNDVLVGTDLTNGYNEASYAYLDGGVILCVSRRKDTLLLNQLLSIDNGQTWTNQGLIPSAYGSNVAPWLNSYIESNGEKYVALFSTLRGVTPGVNAVVGKKNDLMAGVSGWLAETRQVVATAINSDSGYPSVINPRGGKKMLGMSYASNSTLDPLSAIANYTFWNYTPSAVVPAMSVTTNYLPKKTGNASLSDSRVIDDGTVLTVGAKVNASGAAYRNHYADYSNIFQFKNLNLQELSTSGSEESALYFNTFYDNTGNNKYMFNGGASWFYFGKSFFQIAIAQSGTAGANLAGISVPFKIDYSNGSILMDNLAGTGTRTVVADASGNLSAGDVVVAGVKRYKALISQTGTSAPTVIVLENSIGNIVWTRTGVGVYIGTLSNAFTTNKTLSFISDGFITCKKAYKPTGVSTFQINTQDISTLSLSDGQLGGDSILIEVYP